MPHAALALVLALAASSPRATAPSPAAGAVAPATLSFDRLFTVSKAGARVVSPEVEALAGRQVRLVGHMVQMEEPSRGALYLAARPVMADESGGGTGDLPPGAVRVEVPALEHDVPWFEGPLEVVGRLEVGRAEDPQGRVSYIRIVVDLPPAPAARPQAPQHPSPSRDGSPRNTIEGGHP
jgi:hypothetical protein